MWKLSGLRVYGFFILSVTFIDDVSVDFVSEAFFDWLLVLVCRGINLEDFENLVLLLIQIPKLRFVFCKIATQLFVSVL